MPLILVIEDDATQRLATSLALKKAGHNVIEAVDGTQGLEMARRQVPDLIVCDVVMPGLNGYQVVTEIRQDDEISDIPVIMLTAMADRSHVRIGMTSGADDYLAKPFSVRELCDAVAALIAKHNTQRDKIVNSVKTKFLAALEAQRSSLTTQYEQRLMEELNTRWSRGDAANSELHYEEATLLMVDLFGSVLSQLPPSVELGNAVRRAYQGARDTLYLFGARHLLPYGNDLLAIFVGDPASEGVSPRLRAMRAAFGLLKAVTAAMESSFAQGAARAPGPSGVTIALHDGPITLLHVSDPLHGDPDSLLATGEAVSAAASLREFARASNWRIACSGSSAGGMQGLVVTGRRASIAPEGSAPALEAVELLELA